MICTFYSYKGGVGRSMALANVADILARRGLRVLMIDFDLEAPGLEQFFPVNQAGIRRNMGLLDLVVSFKRSMSVAGDDQGEFRRIKKSFIAPVYHNLPSGGSLDLMPAGRREGQEQLARYAFQLRTLDWQEFYANWAGEAFFEWLRKELVPGLYDMVLVDSRTGVTELGGICAYQLADIAVLFCASNHQNVEGTRNVVADSFSPGVAARRGNRPLQVIILPARIEQRDDDLVAAFRTRFAAAFDEYTPEPLQRAGMTFWDFAIPYEPRYAFEERVITDPARADERRPMVAAFRRVVDALALLAEPGTRVAGLRPEVAAKTSVPPAPVEPQYDVTLRYADYNVFMSYNVEDREAVLRIADRLKLAGIRIFLDAWSVVHGESWQVALEEGLYHSRSCAVFVGPSGIGPWQNRDLERLLVGVTQVRADFRVIPVLLPGASATEMPTYLREHRWVDFRSGPDDADAVQRLIFEVQGAPSLVTAQSTVEYVNPYRGLNPYFEQDEQLFFGRDRLVAELLTLLERSRSLALVGPSGCGKSSLVNAGLLPRLRRGILPGSERWIVVALRPGRHPLEALVAALSALAETGADPIQGERLRALLPVDPGALVDAVQHILADRSHSGRLLLIVDQLEELFTQCQNEAEREAFVTAISGAATEIRNLTVILLMRADFYASVEAYPVLTAGMPRDKVFVPPMSAPELREAIERPAQTAGGSFEPGLVDRILVDMEGQPGALPLLQFTLHELWLRRRGGWLTHEAYEQIGGVFGALATRADELFAQLSPELQVGARAILLKLVELVDGRAVTRRRALLAELEPATGAQEHVSIVVEKLVDARLVVTGRNAAGEVTVELAHDALIQSWPRLQSWLEEDREALLVYRQLAQAASEWDQNRRDTSYLFTGTRLSEAEAWADEHSDQISSLVAAFLRASVAQSKWARIVRLVQITGWILIGGAFAYGVMSETIREQGWTLFFAVLALAAMPVIVAIFSRLLRKT